MLLYSFLHGTGLRKFLESFQITRSHANEWGEIWVLHFLIGAVNSLCTIIVLFNAQLPTLSFNFQLSKFMYWIFN